MKEYELCTPCGIAVGGHLHVVGNERYKRIFPDADHDASSIPPRFLDYAGLEIVPFLLAVVPVGAVIFHNQYLAAGQPEHHIEPDGPPTGEVAYVKTAGTKHVVDQREDLALEFRSRLVSS